MTALRLPMKSLPFAPGRRWPAAVGGGFAGWAAGVLLWTCAAMPLSAQESPAAQPLPENASLSQLMTPEEFKASGLKKLSAEELQNLEKWLRGYRAQSEKAAVEKVIPPPSPKRESTQPLIESKIVGMFEGLKGRTRMLLANGQVWQQGNSDDRLSARIDSPPVVLVRTGFGYKMVVNGIGRAFYVRQVVLPR